MKITVRYAGNADAQFVCVPESVYELQLIGSFGAGMLFMLVTGLLAYRLGWFAYRRKHAVVERILPAKNRRTS